MCKACDVTFRDGITSTPVSFSGYTSECLAEIMKIVDWLLGKGYCQDTYSFPLCDNEAFDPTAAFEGPMLGVARALRLEGFGSRQTDETAVRPVSDGECRCTQAPVGCPCRHRAWANRPGG